MREWHGLYETRVVVLALESSASALRTCNDVVSRALGVPSIFGFRAFTRNSEVEELISTLVDLYIPIHITHMSGYSL